MLTRRKAMLTALAATAAPAAAMAPAVASEWEFIDWICVGGRRWKVVWKPCGYEAGLQVGHLGIEMMMPRAA